jgi:hypothetical protein
MGSIFYKKEHCPPSRKKCYNSTSPENSEDVSRAFLFEEDLLSRKPRG